MAKVKVKVKQEIVNGLKGAFSSRTVKRDIAKLTIEEMKLSISRGVSPIKGQRRFKRYKDKASYPGERKSSQPVNLELSGDMLDALDFKPTVKGVLIGIFDSKQKKKAETHQAGLNGVPQRRFIPANEGEDFTITIKRKIRDLFSKIVQEIIRSR